MSKKNEQKNDGPKVSGQDERFITAAEKAQYEVFANGNLPRETIHKWIGNDLRAIQSFVHGVLNEPTIMEAVVNAYYDRYKKMHNENQKENG